MESKTQSLSLREVARLGRVCGRLDAGNDSHSCALELLESPTWREWPETTRRLFEYAYHLIQLEAAERRAS